MNRLGVLAIKHCPPGHHDWPEILSLTKKTDSMQNNTLLRDYINIYFNGNQRKFAEAQGVKPQQVTQWINAGFIVINDVLYSKRRELKRTGR